MMNNALIYIAAGAIFDTFGDLLMQNWVLNSNKTYFAGGMLFYVVGLSFLAYSFTFKNIVVASVLFLIVNVVLLSLVNWLVYDESLSYREMGGLCLGLMAIALFEFN
ncbi:cation/cationic drug transporter [Aequorivita sublithincola DSM 14238]|uniref:Cation/cationic drug transporter n=1 Tax=Aequorivita sublithincola (strain DSM 14238 / LMG 21431 / ACAM 643 / 9-3) TaxID=746697 RepID=I3YTZ2_AEQSU|nr:cation/cationic drug transporter [Aequorivita sublithincola]AFL80460.1 cation/cationic drug transporter [Aequorivita sublithincola DSM 14238]